jgi:hypothetical protein
MKAVAASGKFAEIPPCSWQTRRNRGVKRRIKTCVAEANLSLALFGSAMLGVRLGRLRSV